MEYILEVYLNNEVDIDKIKTLSKRLKKELRDFKVSKYSIKHYQDISIDNYNPIAINSYIKYTISSPNEIENEEIYNITKEFTFIKRIKLYNKTEIIKKDDLIYVNKKRFIDIIRQIKKTKKLINEKNVDLRYYILDEIFKMQFTSFEIIEKNLIENLEKYFKKYGYNIIFKIKQKNSVNIYIENYILGMLYTHLQDFIKTYISTFYNNELNTQNRVDIEIYQKMEKIILNIIGYDINYNEVEKIKDILNDNFVVKNNNINKIIKTLKQYGVDISTTSYQNKHKISLELTQKNYILPSYILEIANKKYAVDMSQILEIVNIQFKNIKKIGDMLIYKHGEKEYPLINMCQYLKLSDDNDGCYNIFEDKEAVLISDDTEILLVFDKYVGVEEIEVFETTAKQSYIIKNINCRSNNDIKLIDINKLLSTIKEEM